MEMKVSDYIVEFLIKKEITDVFGYPGGMVTHLMDSFYKYRDKIHAHVNYHEQAAAFAACGYAQVSHRPGVAYATSGPGATNLITGIANAYFDSIPTIFITGQVNTYEAASGNLKQKGFQETDIISMVKPITKYCKYIDDANILQEELEKAYQICTDGRKGPVLLDIPMNIQRTMINIQEQVQKHTDMEPIEKSIDLKKYIADCRRPVLLLGNGAHECSSIEIQELIKELGIPVVTSMIAVDLVDKDNMYNYGFIGAYGSRVANFVIAKADLIISLGSRMDIRQVGADTKGFSPQAKLVRFDIDTTEFERKIKEDELQIHYDIENAISILRTIKFENTILCEWKNVCDEIKNKLLHYDDREYNHLIEQMSTYIPDEYTITTDVGQNQVWVAQSFRNKIKQRILFSGGLGSMGYSLPAAIGAYYGTKRPVISFNGDGGLQMNIQELQFIARENIPIKIIILNNKSLGMIRHFQEMYFDSTFTQTKKEYGYTSPDFQKLANAYGISYIKGNETEQLQKKLIDNQPCIIELELSDTTYVHPKLAMGKLNYDQEPSLPKDILDYLLSL